jgi:hypothetical protein
MDKGNTCREDNVWEEPEAEVMTMLFFCMEMKNWFSYKRTLHRRTLKFTGM